MESDIWTKPPLYFKVWHYLLLNANYKDSGTLKRGQLFTSINEIREACSYYVGYRKITPSRQEIFRILEYLRSLHEDDNERDSNDTMIRTTKVTHGMVISIVNYGLYQDPTSYERYNERDDEKSTNGLRIGRHDDNKKKKEKKEERKNIYIGAKFNNSPARNYDMNDLEKKLLATN